MEELCNVQSDFYSNPAYISLLLVIEQQSPERESVKISLMSWALSAKNLITTPILV